MLVRCPAPIINRFKISVLDAPNTGMIIAYFGALLHINETGGHLEALKTANDTLFILLGAIMVLAMHAGFAFLELGTVRAKNQVNALVKILADFAVSTIANVSRKKNLTNS